MEHEGCYGCGCLARRLADAQATVEALQGERDKLREATKVICGHCCEPMAIPSKAILQSQLSALQGLVREFVEAWDHDGEPNAAAYESVVAKARAALPATPTAGDHSPDIKKMLESETVATVTAWANETFGQASLYVQIQIAKNNVFTIGTSVLLIDELPGEWLGPISPDTYQQGRVAGLREAAKEVVFHAYARDAAIAFEIKANKLEQQAQGARK